MTPPNSSSSSDSTAASATPSTRWAVLHDLEDWLETPMLILGFAWLVLLVVELTRGISRPLEIVGTGIWIVFIADFLLRLWLSPDRRLYVRRNWLTALSLLLPALRVVRLVAAVRLARAARAARALRGVTRGARVLRLVSSVNRGMAALRRSMARRGLGFVMLLTAIVMMTGAAGMYAFERDLSGERGMHSFGSALWWTAMLMTTMGSEYWPRSAEGRALCLLLAVYAFAVFGYVTASLATFFIGRDAADPDAEIPGVELLAEMRGEIAALHGELRALRSSLSSAQQRE
jgi:voltage-gated potassium channel